MSGTIRKSTSRGPSGEDYEEYDYEQYRGNAQPGRTTSCGESCQAGNRRCSAAPQSLASQSAASQSAASPVEAKRGQLRRELSCASQACCGMMEGETRRGHLRGSKVPGLATCVKEIFAHFRRFNQNGLHTAQVESALRRTRAAACQISRGLSLFPNVARGW